MNVCRFLHFTKVYIWNYSGVNPFKIIRKSKNYNRVIDKQKIKKPRFRNENENKRYEKSRLIFKLN